MNRWMNDEWTAGWMDGWMDGLVDGWMDQQTLDPTWHFLSLPLHHLYSLWPIGAKKGPREKTQFPFHIWWATPETSLKCLLHRFSGRDISAVWGYQRACLSPETLALYWDKVDRTGAAHCPFGGSQTHCFWVCFGAGCERAVNKHGKLPTLIPPFPDFPKQDQQVHCPTTVAAHQNVLDTRALHVHLLVTVTHCLTLLRRQVIFLRSLV